MSFAVQSISPAQATNAGAPTQAASGYTPSFNQGADSCHFGNSGQKGSRSNIGLLTGALTCCALPFFALGAVVALAGVAAIRRGFTTVKSIPGVFQHRIG